MTNDTSTLTGALREAGETLAANLTTQGVPSTWDEGLTTLIGKVLDITPGPTPSFDGITLSGDKSILSAADSEYATLTAQLTDGGSAASVEGETVTFTVYKDSDDSVVTTLTADTNSSGVATVSYYGQGTGDLYVQAECTFVSETYSLEDCMLYDSVEYSKKGTGSATSVATNNKTWDNTVDWECCADIKVTGGSSRIDIVPPAQSLNYHIGLGKNGSNQLASYIGKNGGGESTTAHTSKTISNNTYYPVKITKQASTIKYYFNNELVHTDSSTASGWIGNYNTESVKFTTWASNTIYMKNLKVKPL